MFKGGLTRTPSRARLMVSEPKLGVMRMARKRKEEDDAVLNAVESGNGETPTRKSIVPSKYAGRYKNGGEDALANFIKEQCATQEGFSFERFFQLCLRNGIAEDKVAHYAQQVQEKRHGAEGRARMTLRNMLATFVRKNGKATALDGQEVPLSLPKATLTGAAKAAADKASAAEEAQAST